MSGVALAILFSLLGGFFFGSYTTPIKSTAVREAGVHPMIFQWYSIAFFFCLASYRLDSTLSLSLSLLSLSLFLSLSLSLSSSTSPFLYKISYKTFVCFVCGCTFFGLKYAIYEDQHFVFTWWGTASAFCWIPVGH